MLIQSELVALLNDVFKQRGRLRKGGMQLTYHCPQCPDKNPITQKLEVAIGGPDIGNYHCWRCNFRGKSFGSLLWKLNAPIAYRDKLFKLTGDIRLSKRRSIVEKSSTIILPEEFQPMTKQRNTPEYKNALVYLKRRGILPCDIVRYNIGYCETGEYEQHIIIPSYDASGVLNFFIGRRYYETEGNTLPYKKPRGNMNIVGFECFVNWKEPPILVEGVFNAITIRNNAIPMFGKFPSEKLYTTIIENGVEKVYVCLDSDAEREALSICNRLIELGRIPCLVKISGGKDANEIGFENIGECIRSAEEVDSLSLSRKRMNS